MDSSTGPSFVEKIRSVSFLGRGKANRTRIVADAQAREAERENMPTSRG